MHSQNKLFISQQLRIINHFDKCPSKTLSCLKNNLAVRPTFVVVRKNLEIICLYFIGFISLKLFFSKTMSFRVSDHEYLLIEKISFYPEKLIKISGVEVRSREMSDYPSIYVTEIFCNTKNTSKHLYYHTILLLFHHSNMSSCLIVQ